MTVPTRGLRPRTPSSPGSLAVARSTGHWLACPKAVVDQ